MIFNFILYFIYFLYFPIFFIFSFRAVRWTAAGLSPAAGVGTLLQACEVLARHLEVRVSHRLRARGVVKVMGLKRRPGPGGWNLEPWIDLRFRRKKRKRAPRATKSGQDPESTQGSPKPRRVAPRGMPEVRRPSVGRV